MRTHGITIPETETQFAVGTSTIYVIDVDKERSANDNGWDVVVTGHDDHGEEVEVKFWVEDDEDGDW